MCRFSFSAVAILCLVGCSEYEFNSNHNPVNEPDTGAPPHTGEVFRTCEDMPNPETEEVPLNTSCEVSYSTGTFTPVVEWTYGYNRFCGPAAVGQLRDSNGSGGIDKDDLPVVVIYQMGRVIALHGDSGGEAWVSSNQYGSFASNGDGDYGGLALGDVNNDGWPDVVTAGSSSVCALDGRDGTELWCQASIGYTMDPLGYNYPAIADMDGDGRAEVTMGAVILHGDTGQVRGSGAYGSGTAPYYQSYGTYGALSVPIDLDNDGQLELVTGNAAYDADGNTKWYNGGMDGLVAVADFDADGQGEIVVTSGAYVRGLESDGTVVWENSYASGAYLSIGTPAIDDLDGDDIPEIVFAVQDKLIAIDWGGSEIWRTPITDMSGAAGPTLFDFEMDGYPEVLYQDEGTIRFFNGLDGTVKYESPEHGSVTILETPIVADVDGDDQAEIVVGHCETMGFFGGITVFGDQDESWPPGRKWWNQHGYYITNVDDQGLIPTGTPPNYGLYNSFRSGDVGRPPNEYWDLVAEITHVCEDECGDGLAYITARVGNAGNTESPEKVVLSLRAGEEGAILDTITLLSSIPAGQTSEVVHFEVSTAAIAGHNPVVTADENLAGANTIYECDEDNNSDTWPEPMCGYWAP